MKQRCHGPLFFAVCKVIQKPCRINLALGILLKDSGKARNTAYELSQEFRI